MPTLRLWLLVAAPLALSACWPPDHDVALLRRILFPSSAEGDPKALIGGFRAGAPWKRVRADRSEALRLREEGPAEAPVRALHHELEGSDRNALSFEFELRDGDVIGVTAHLTGEGDDNRAVLHGLAAEAFVWLDARFGAETSWCSDAAEAYPIDAEFHVKIEKDSVCWWKVDGKVVAQLERRHQGPETPGRTYVEVDIWTRLEGIPEANQHVQAP
jgi:hypothetical protein